MRERGWRGDGEERERRGRGEGEERERGGRGEGEGRERGGRGEEILPGCLYVQVRHGHCVHSCANVPIM